MYLNKYKLIIWCIYKKKMIKKLISYTKKSINSIEVTILNKMNREEKRNLAASIIRKDSKKNMKKRSVF